MNLLAQAELEKVRDMFSKPNAYIDVEIWKGYMENAHPVEFYLARRNQEIKGYYRIISSGDEFAVEGEINANKAIISEYDSENNELGIFHIDSFINFELGEKILLKWFNVNRDDIIEFDLTASRFSDYPDGLFHPEVVKYSRYEDKTREHILIEQLNSKEIILHISKNLKEETHRLTVNSLSPLDFKYTSEGKEYIYEEINEKLRKRVDGQIFFYNRENSLEIQPLTYASTHFLCNVEYPEANNPAFNKWISTMIQKRRNATRKDVNQRVKAIENPADGHFYYKWNSWTEIDYLSDNIISGRMVFIRSWQDTMETFSFHYDLQEEEPFDILNEFKGDFNMKDYLNKFIQSELTKYHKQNRTDKYDLKLQDYTELAITDNYLIVSTKFHWLYGYHKMKIPYSELEGLLKRNSILKPVMKS